MTRIELLDKKELLDLLKEECKIVRTKEMHDGYNFTRHNLFITVKMHSNLLSHYKLQFWTKKGLQTISIKRRRRLIIKFLIK